MTKNKKNKNDLIKKLERQTYPDVFLMTGWIGK